MDLLHSCINTETIIFYLPFTFSDRILRLFGMVVLGTKKKLTSSK